MIPFPAMKYREIGEEADVQRLLDDPLWVLEQKMDGTRGLALLRQGMSPVMLAGNGAPLKHTAATQHLGGIWEALAPLQEQLLPGDVIILDGELMILTGEFRVFDLPRATLGRLDRVLDGDTFWHRRSVLLALFESRTDQWRPVSLVRTAVGGRDKHAMFAAAREMGVEGVMLKHVHHTYQSGKRTDQAVKVKFVHTADVVVTQVVRSRNDAGREVGSISFMVPGPEGTPELAGTCSVIGKPEVHVFDVIEVAYLYRSPQGGGLIQPRMVRVREDKTPEDCRMDQFPAYSREVL